MLSTPGDTVDGGNPAPPMVETLEIVGCLPPFSTVDSAFAGPSTVPSGKLT